MISLPEDVAANVTIAPTGDRAAQFAGDVHQGIAGLHDIGVRRAVRPVVEHHRPDFTEHRLPRSGGDRRKSLRRSRWPR